MFKALFHPQKARFKMTILLNISITLFMLYGCQATQSTLKHGQDAQFLFPYPCDSTEVTIRHGYNIPFYRLTDGSSLSLPQDQAHRFKVQNRSENGNCYLDLTISNLMRSDVGTYMSSIYKDGQLLNDLTTRVGLQIESPPGKASCIEGKNQGGGWVAMECTADVGSISGKIECYQNGEKMPSLTDPVETHTTLTQIILIRETQPAFCCSSTLHEDKTRCECNDTALNLADESSKDPCPSPSTTTFKPFDITESQETNSTAFHYLSTMVSNTSNSKSNYNKAMIIHSVLFPAEVIVAMVSITVHYKLKQKKRSSGNDSQKSDLSLKGNTVQTNGFSEIKTNPDDPKSGLISGQV